MTEEQDAPLYAKAEGYLSQGDIFKCHLLGTYGGTALSILRDESGARPGNTFSSNAGLKFVRAAEVAQFLKCQEIVACEVEHLNYFVIVTQTCDVAGEDHAAAATCLVAKILTICDFVNHVVLPFKWRHGSGESEVREIEVARFLAENVGEGEADALNKACENEAEYPNALRQVLRSWKPKANSNEQIFKAKLQSFLTDITHNKEGRTYYFPQNPEFNMPEAFVDLGAVFPVAVTDIQAAKEDRVATLANPYKEDFSQRVAMRFGRVAVPVPIKGERF